MGYESFLVTSFSARWSTATGVSHFFNQNYPACPGRCWWTDNFILKHLNHSVRGHTLILSWFNWESVPCTDYIFHKKSLFRFLRFLANTSEYSSRSLVIAALWCRSKLGLTFDSSVKAPSRQFSTSASCRTFQIRSSSGQYMTCPANTPLSATSVSPCELFDPNRIL